MKKEHPYKQFPLQVGAKIGETISTLCDVRLKREFRNYLTLKVGLCNPAFIWNRTSINHSHAMYAMTSLTKCKQLMVNIFYQTIFCLQIFLALFSYLKKEKKTGNSGKYTDKINPLRAIRVTHAIPY